jgi:hypothetical protein
MLAKTKGFNDADSLISETMRDAGHNDYLSLLKYLNDRNNASVSNIIQTDQNTPPTALPVKRSKVSYVAIIASITAACSVFLPWIEASSSASFMVHSANYTTGGISGISVKGGEFCLLISLACVYLAFKRIQWTFALGVVSLILGLGYMFNWFGTGSASYSSNFGGLSAEVSVNPQIGLYLFVFASLVFSIFTLKYLKGEK